MSEKIYKTVIDTNVFIKAWFFNDSECQEILDLVKNRKIYLAFSQDSIGELMYVTKNFARQYLSSDKKKQIALIEGVAKLFLYGSSVNTVGMEDIPEVKDKTDLMFVHCAIGYKDSDFLISNDFKSGMFDVDSTYSFRVISSSEFLEFLNE
ncbi:putative toxin-antitoxin system toxin component, PIN family [Peribacillus phoenicis]|uniref:putative toxin-antitoxin system toxin component, PIN family n=1 Tax=unclassified Peribacillus TaxID=2675266 RepID=UPI00399EEC58